ncbi:ATP-binding protein [Nocardioides caldifontis]|uniref:ATP-binding protein n=1 Tax=Nocardioides caldifontis TaxID=2588938 RepID=UPI0011E04784|nr:ATP-binding protein [Nocardioides caldifontis]
MTDAAFFRHVVDSAVDGIWVCDPTGRTLFANPRTAELLGRSPAEMEGLSLFDVLDAQGREEFAAHLEQVRRTGPNLEDVECVYHRPDGTPVRLVVSESVLLDETGEISGFVYRLTHDARLRVLLHELSSSREQLDEAQAIARLGSWELDLRTDRLQWSRQMYVIFDVDPATYVPSLEGFFRRIHPDDQPVLEESMRNARLGQPGYGLDFRYVRKDGSIGWFRGLGRTQHDDQGRPVRMRGTVQEVTDLKETELQLLDSVVLNTLMQVMAAAANESATLAEALATVREALLGHDDWQRAVGFEVVPGADGTRDLEVYRGVEAAQEEPTPVERALAERVLEKGGVVFEETAHPETPSIGFPLVLGGEPLLVVVITACSPFERHAMLRSLVGQVSDQLARVAEREQAAKELASARDAAMEASRLKSRFLATMSHEIRTPMNGVIGLNELLLRTDLDPHQRRLAQGVQIAGQALLGLINDILDFSKIEAGELELEAVEFEVRGVFDQVTTMLASSARDKGLAMEIRVDPDVPARVVGDPTRLGQVLSNLVSNAVKFTREGGVDVHATVVEQAPDEVTLRFEVADTGIGISEPQRQRLFEPFRQADASTTRTFGGTGLGLAIARQLVSALGGELGVESTPDAGSTFWFTARFAAASTVETTSSRPGAAPSPASTSSRLGHVLVVEDNEINQLVALGLLEALGYTAEVAPTGEEAVKLVHGRRYHAVLMDLQMPGMDGYAASRQIRAEEPEGHRVPIVAMTASAIEGERERCLAAGMDDFLTKPVTSARLEAVLRRYAATPTAVPEVVEEPPAPSVPALDPGRIDELLALGERAVPLVERAVGNFVKGMPDVLAELGKAVADEDAAALRAAAHKLKGSALNLGAKQVADVSRRLEELADEGRTTDAAPVLEELREAAPRACEALDTYQAERLAVRG